MRTSGDRAEREGAQGARRRFLTAPGAAIVVAVWLASLLLWIQPGIVRPDGAGYLVYLPSAWLDHDLLFFNEWQEMRMVPNGIILHKQITATDHLANHWTVGSALVWFPAFAIADRIGGFPPNGISLPYNIAIVFTSAIAGLIALLAGMRASRATPYAAAVAATGTWLGTPLLWYSLVHATMAHAVSAMACGLVFVVRREGRPSAAEEFLAGAAAGIAFAVRPQNAPFAAVPPLLNRAYFSLPYAAGLALGGLPQLVVSTFVYGSPLGFLGDGRDFATYHGAFERTYVVETLLSWYHGVLPWTPFAALGIVGLVLLLRSDWRLAIACLLMFVAQWMMNGMLDRAFWSGLSFGQRRFDNCTVVFLIGAAAFVDRVGRPIGTALVATAASWTMSLFFAARRGLDLASYLTPTELFAAQRAIATQFVPLGAVPESARLTVLALLAGFTLAALIAFVAFRWMSNRNAAVLVGMYLVAASLFLVWCGRNDVEHVIRYRALIDRNRTFGHLPAGVDYRVALLRDEAEFLRKSGREAEAQKTEAEIRRRSAR